MENIFTYDSPWTPKGKTLLSWRLIFWPVETLFSKRFRKHNKCFRPKLCLKNLKHNSHQSFWVFILLPWFSWVECTEGILCFYWEICILHKYALSLFLHLNPLYIRISWLLKLSNNAVSENTVIYWTSRKAIQTKQWLPLVRINCIFEASFSLSLI